MIRIIPSKDAGALLTRRAAKLDAAEAVVRPILDAVRNRGDDALLEYARRFDRLERPSVVVSAEERAASLSRLQPEFVQALETAAVNIRAFASRQLPREYLEPLSPGLFAGQIVRPLDTVAAYIPGGRYPLPSTLMMTLIPAQVAGVPRMYFCCPRLVDEVFGTGHWLGATDAFLMGGAHAIAAFAFGTESVPRADRIVGPGNIYVAAAKKLLAGETGIDFVAGPTEILIIAEDADPQHLAADMLAQAEHDVDAASILLTTSRPLAEQVAQNIEKQLATLSTASVARPAIDNNSAIVVVSSTAEAVELSNQFAPEHLSIYDEALLPGIRHAGSVFVGPFSPEAAGDYASGPNHVLPTGGHARLRAGLSAADFVKVISVQRLDAAALAHLAPTITTLARAEGLEAHARSVEVRLS